MLSTNEPNHAQPAVQPPDPMDFVEAGATNADARCELATYPEHPLFPLDDGQVETRDIHYVTFRRRRSDGRIDNCPEDVSAKDLNSWAEVIGPWGGGEYKAIGKDKNHRIVAWYPPEKGSWLLFDQPSKPFTLRDGTAYGRGVDAPAPRPAPPAPAPPQTDPMMLAMFNQAAETNRTILAAALSGNKESNTWELVRALKEMQPNPLDWLRAVREMLPAPVAAPAPAAQLSLPEQLDTVKTILDWTRPPPAMPEPSALGEIGSLVTTIIQSDAAARAATRSPDPPERRPPPPQRNPRLVHVPGVGLVDVVHPEAAPPPGLPAPVAMAAPSAAPVAHPRTSVGHLDSPSPAPVGVVVAPSTARATRAPTDAREGAREQLAAPDAAPVPSDSVIDLVEALRRDPVALEKLVRALGVPPPVTVAEVAAPPPATQAHLAAADVDVRDPHAVASTPVRSAPSVEPAPPAVPLRPRLVRDEVPASAAPAPVREAPPAPRPPAGVAGVHKPAPPHAATDVPRRAPDVGSLGSDASSERVPSPAAQTRVESSPKTARADHVQGPSPAAAPAHAPPPPVPSTPQRVIALPAQMPQVGDSDVTSTRQDDSPAAPGPELTAAEREQAASTLASLPRDKLVAYLKRIPGLAPQADDLVRALADVPPEAIPILVGHLPPEHARALASMLKDRKGG